MSMITVAKSWMSFVKICNEQMSIFKLRMRSLLRIASNGECYSAKIFNDDLGMVVLGFA